MALSDVTVTFNLTQLLGEAFDARRTRAYVKTNVANGTLMDTSTGEIRLGDQKVTVGDDGTGEFTTWAPGADGNPTSWQTSLVVEYPRTGQRDRTVRTFGPYTITASADLADLEEEQAVPAEYLTQVTDELQTYSDAAASSATAAQTARTGAEAARDEAQALVLSDLGTTDGQTRALIENPLSQTASALSASIDDAAVSASRYENLLALAAPQADSAPWLVCPPGATFAASAAAAWYTANAATFMRFSIGRRRTFRYVNLQVGTQSGNIEVGVVRLRPGNVSGGVNYERVAWSGSIACPASGAQRIDLGYFVLPPGEYALYLWCDNTTAAFLHGLASGFASTRLLFTNTGATPPGSSAAIGTISATTRWLSGITLESAPLPISLLGDSITANDTAAPGGAGSWFSRADQATGYRFYGETTNNGVPGERTDQILARAAAAFSGKRYATILAGTNDIGQSVAAATIIANLDSLYDAAVSAGLQAFAVCTIPPRSADTAGAPLSASQKAAWIEVNAWIRSHVSDYPGAQLIDWGTALSVAGDPTAPNPSLFTDYVHPNSAGATVMAARVAPVIAKWA